MKQTTAPTALLKFSRGNNKLPKSTMIFSLPAGHSCPGAKDCKSSVSVDPVTGKASITDGEAKVFRCYAATSELIYKGVREARQHNFDLLKPFANQKDVDGMVKLILTSMNEKGMKGVERVRVHESGDYFSLYYFQAWMQVATAFPEVKFYSYTKSLPHVVKGQEAGIIPPNFLFTASKGGHFDYLIERHGFKSVTVTTNQAETEQALKDGGVFDHDDNLALGGSDFYLKVHGQQPKGTPAAKYWDMLVKSGRGGYNKKAGKANGGKVIQMKPIKAKQAKRKAA